MGFSVPSPQQHHPCPGKGEPAESWDLGVLFSMDHLLNRNIFCFSGMLPRILSQPVSVMLYFDFDYEVVGFFFFFFLNNGVEDH